MHDTGPHVAFVSGAGKGIGRATVERLLADGRHVVAGVRDVDLAREEYGEQEALEIVRCEVTDPESVASAIASAEAIGPIDVLVCNAGHAMFSAIEESDQDLAREMFEVNVFGAGNVVKAALPGMREHGHGTVVMISSVAARGAAPMLGWYSASKAALASITESLAVEVRPFGIRVVSLEPGMVATGFSGATRISGPATGGEGPYAPLFGAMFGAFGRWRERYTSSAEDVADAVMGAIADPATPLHHLVGDDAREIAQLRSGDDGHAAQAAVLRDFLGIEWGA